MTVEELKSMPKTELHVHLEALMSLDTLKELVMKYKLSNSQIDALQESIANGYTNILDFFNYWHFLNSALKTEEDFERVTYEYLLGVSEFNTKYVELNLNILRQIEKGLNPLKLVKAIFEGQKQAEKKSGIISRTLLSYSRSFSLEEGKMVVDMADKYKEMNIVGIDVAGNEKEKPNALFKEVFEYADKKGIKKTAHAGEGAMQNSISDAINLLGVTRIGHGIDAAGNENLIKLLKEKEVGVELCVTSNHSLGFVKSIEEHPGKEFIKNGLDVILNTDDPTLLGRSLLDEYQLISNSWGLTKKDFYQIYRNGVKHSFVEDEVKEELFNY